MRNILQDLFNIRIHYRIHIYVIQEDEDEKNIVVFVGGPDGTGYALCRAQQGFREWKRGFIRGLSPVYLVGKHHP
jgi:hypothetical protein